MLKKYKNVITYILFFIIFLFVSYFISPITGDEIWNFGFSYNIYSGLVPYKDFNVILTPFYFFINAFLFRIFRPHVFVMYVFNAIMATITLFFAKKINPNSFCFIYALLILLGIFFFFPNYNLFCMYLFVICLYLQSTRRYNFLVGLIIGIIFITKHSIGIFLVLPIFVNFFKDRRGSLIQLLGFIVPVVILILYLFIQNSFYEFINYCFLGLFDFTKNNGRLGFLAIIELCIVIFLVYKMINNKSNFMDYLYLLCFQIIAVPLFDFYHCLLGLVPILIYFLNSKNIRYYALIIFSFSFLFVYFYYNHGRLNTNSKYFTYRNFSNNILDGYYELHDYVSNYYSNYDIYLITSNSYLYKLENNLSINEFDLLLYGNLGYDSYNRITSFISNTDRQTLFIISDTEYFMNDQLHDEIIEYIFDNSTIVDSFYSYNFYKFGVNN